jgi:hypothetical protein
MAVVRCRVRWWTLDCDSPFSMAISPTAFATSEAGWITHFVSEPKPISFKEPCARDDRARLGYPYVRLYVRNVVEVPSTNGFHGIPASGYMCGS